MILVQFGDRRLRMIRHCCEVTISSICLCDHPSSQFTKHSYQTFVPNIRTKHSYQTFVPWGDGEVVTRLAALSVAPDRESVKSNSTHLTFFTSTLVG
jgi:hypothetical protein